MYSLDWKIKRRNWKNQIFCTISVVIFVNRFLDNYSVKLNANDYFYKTYVFSLIRKKTNLFQKKFTNGN